MVVVWRVWPLAWIETMKLAFLSLALLLTGCAGGKPSPQTGELILYLGDIDSDCVATGVFVANTYPPGADRDATLRELNQVQTYDGLAAMLHRLGVKLQSVR